MNRQEIVSVTRRNKRICKINMKRKELFTGIELLVEAMRIYLKLEW